MWAYRTLKTGQQDPTCCWSSIAIRFPTAHWNAAVFEALLMGRNLLFDMWDRLLCVLFHSDLGTILKFYILFCEDISYQPFIQVQYSCFTNTAEVHEGAILPLSVEDFSSWGTAHYLFNSTHNSTQHNNLGQEGKNCARSMRQSDNCCITTDTETWNLTGTLGPGTPLILMLCL